MPGADAARPVLINLWYPVPRTSSGPRLTERAYASLASTQFPALATELSIKNFSVISASLDNNAPARQHRLEKFLNTRAAAIRGAQPVNRKFPLVVYIQGFGSSTQDNVVLCEWLASHGYVVANSAYQDESATMIGGRSDVAGDITFIVSYAGHLPFVDRHHVAIVGHSGGAQNALVYASRHPSIINALVALDTTQDYYPLSFAAHSFVKEVEAGSIDVPILAVARPEAIFQLQDKFVHCERLYLTVRAQEHDEFISQGAIADLYQHTKKARTARIRYDELCRYILAFLDSELKASPQQLARKIAALGAPDFENHPINVEHMPIGAESPPPLDRALTTAPTPRQMYALITSAPIAAALELLKRHWHTASASALYTGAFGLAAVEHLLDSGRVSDARQIANWYEQVPHERIESLYVSFGDLFKQLHATKSAVFFYERAIQLKPTDRDAIAKLAALNTKAPTVR